MVKEKLNPQQRKFVENILTGMNQTDAYMKAGYKSKTRKTIGNNASRLMENDIIRAEIDCRLEAITDNAYRILKANTTKAAEKLVLMMEWATENDRNKLAAVKDVLDRAGLKPEEKVKLQQRIIVEFDDGSQTHKSGSK